MCHKVQVTDQEKIIFVVYLSKNLGKYFSILLEESSLQLIYNTE